MFCQLNTVNLSFDLFELVKLAHEKLNIPVTCKIRVFEDDNKTIKYAQMLEKSGCQVH